MRMRLSEPEMVHEYGKGWRLSFLVDSDSVKKAQQCVDIYRKKHISIDPTEWKDHRSLSANAYFHVLVEKIAEALTLGEDEVKENLVLNYGAQLRNDDGTPVGLKLPKVTDPHLLGIKYPKWFDTRTEDGKEFNCWIVYGETHTYDTKQMARLIDGTINEIKTTEALKHIDTMPQAALEEMYARTYKEATDTKAS